MAKFWNPTGQSVGAVSAIVSATDVMRELTEGTELLLGAIGRSVLPNSAVPR